MQKTIPSHLYNCRNWLLKNNRMKDASLITYIIDNCEKAIELHQNVAIAKPEETMLKGILEEYCAAHGITPAYKERWSVGYDFGYGSHFSDAMHYVWETMYKGI